MLDASFNIKVIDILILFSIALFTAICALLIASYKKQIERTRLLREFLDIVSEKIKVEEDFNEIVKRIDGETE